MKLPSVSASFAISLDGKIAPRSPRAVAAALELRTKSDAILAGCDSMEAGDVLPPEKLRVIFTNSGCLRRSSPVFQGGAPVVVFTTKVMPAATRRWLEKCAVLHVEPRASKVNLRRALQMLSRDYDVRSALCEGGPELFRELLKQQLVSTLHIAIMPVVIGGADTPTLLGPAHSSLLPRSIPLRLQKFRQEGDEAFAVYRVLHAAASSPSSA